MSVLVVCVAFGIPNSVGIAWTAPVHCGVTQEKSAIGQEYIDISAHAI